MSDPYKREAAKAAIKVLQRELAEARRQRDALAEALEQFVNVCDYAPPVDIIKHIGESCASARKALAAVKGGQHE